jgi:hypothetical protein
MLKSPLEVTAFAPSVFFGNILIGGVTPQGITRLVVGKENSSSETASKGLTG